MKEFELYNVKIRDLYMIYLQLLPYKEICIIILKIHDLLNMHKTELKCILINKMMTINFSLKTLNVNGLESMSVEYFCFKIYYVNNSQKTFTLDNFY